MKCTSPISIKNPSKDREFGTNYIQVPCGKCFCCRSNKVNEWRFRLKKSVDFAKYASFFITLTYAEENIHPDGLCKKDLQCYFKRLRKAISDAGISVRLKYFAVGEYGGRHGRQHFHIILINCPLNLEQLTLLNNDKWTFGHNETLPLEDGALTYVVGDIHDRSSLEEYEKQGISRPFNCVSKGIGKEYVSDETKELHAGSDPRFYVVDNGYTQVLPRYYFDKFFTEGTIRVRNYCNPYPRCYTDQELQSVEAKEYSFKKRKQHKF